MSQRANARDEDSMVFSTAWHSGASLKACRFEKRLGLRKRLSHVHWLVQYPVATFDTQEGGGAGVPHSGHDILSDMPSGPMTVDRYWNGTALG